MRKFMSKRSALLAVVGVLAISAAAIAYFSSVGSGTGTGVVTATTGAVAVTVTPDTTFTKIGDTVTFTVNATNNGTSDVFAAIKNANVVINKPASCPTGSFTLGTITNASKQLAANGGAGDIGTIPVTLNETNSLQDACLAGITLTVPTV